MLIVAVVKLRQSGGLINPQCAYMIRHQVMELKGLIADLSYRKSEGFVPVIDAYGLLVRILVWFQFSYVYLYFHINFAAVEQYLAHKG